MKKRQLFSNLVVHTLWQPLVQLILQYGYRQRARLVMSMAIIRPSNRALTVVCLSFDLSFFPAVTP